MKAHSVLYCLLGFAYSCLSLSAATFTVTTTNDTGAGSLRAAITSANGSSGTNTIEFNISPLDGTVNTITPLSQLPTITRPVIIDGYTQDPTHSHANTLANGENAKLLIEISGAIVEVTH